MHLSMGEAQLQFEAWTEMVKLWAASDDRGQGRQTVWKDHMVTILDLMTTFSTTELCISNTKATKDNNMERNRHNCVPIFHIIFSGHKYPSSVFSQPLNV